jgi:two-component system, NtrC family, response regulator HydG
MRRRILVVDDDRRTVKALCDVLRARGWEAAAAYSGEEAIRSATTRSFAAVLLEARMEEWSGVGALRTIQQLQPHVPVVLMSASATDEVLALAQRKGVLALLHKPIQWPLLMKLLDGVIRTSGNVLIINDDPDVLYTLGRALAESGHGSLSARTLLEALRILEAEAPGVLILDLKLTGRELYDAASAIKTIDPEIALILCSGPDMLDQAVARLPAAWVYARLRRPFQPEQLVAMLNALYS